MNDLIERLEKTTGDSFDECRDLDLEIALKAGWKLDKSRLPGAPLSDHEGRYHFTAPLYTLSIDAALTLVPKGFRWKLTYSRHVPCVAEVIDYRGAETGKIIGRCDGECDSNHAIALCIAALRARESIAMTAAEPAQ